MLFCVCSEIPSFFNFVKASIGSGSFVLPWAMKQSGIIVGSAGLILLGVVRWVTHSGCCIALCVGHIASCYGCIASFSSCIGSSGGCIA